MKEALSCCQRSRDRLSSINKRREKEVEFQLGERKYNIHTELLRLLPYKLLLLAFRFFQLHAASGQNGCRSLFHLQLFTTRVARDPPITVIHHHHRGTLRDADGTATTTYQHIHTCSRRHSHRGKEVFMVTFHW